jgi:hypothetical protein
VAPAQSHEGTDHTAKRVGREMRNPRARNPYLYSAVF